VLRLNTVSILRTTAGLQDLGFNFAYVKYENAQQGLAHPVPTYAARTRWGLRLALRGASL
jgi:hypothetical protein